MMIRLLALSLILFSCGESVQDDSKKTANTAKQRPASMYNYDPACYAQDDSTKQEEPKRFYFHEIEVLHKLIKKVRPY